MPSRPVSAAQHRVATFQSGASANHSMFLAPHLWQKSSGWIVGQPALRSFSISAGGIDWALMLRLSVRHVTAYDHEAATHPAPQNAHRPCRAHPANTPQRQGTCRKCFSRLESSPCSPRLRRTSWVARRRGWGRCLRRRLSHATTHSWQSHPHCTADPRVNEYHAPPHDECKPLSHLNVDTPFTGGRVTRSPPRKCRQRTQPNSPHGT